MFQTDKNAGCLLIIVLQESNLTVWQPCKAPITSYHSFFQCHLVNEKAESTLGRVQGSDTGSVTSTCQIVIIILNPSPQHTDNELRWARDKVILVLKFKFLNHYLRIKCRAPAYSRALRCVRGVIERVAKRWSKPGKVAGMP